MISTEYQYHAARVSPVLPGIWAVRRSLACTKYTVRWRRQRGFAGDPPRSGPRHGYTVPRGRHGWLCRSLRAQRDPAYSGGDWRAGEGLNPVLTLHSTLSGSCDVPAEIWALTDATGGPPGSKGGRRERRRLVAAFRSGRAGAATAATRSHGGHGDG